MIKTTEFSIDVLKTHKVFFLLDNLPKSSSEVDVWIQTPTGLDSVDFIDIFTMKDGSLLAAWKHPYQKLPLHNLTAFCDGKTQIINLCPAERMVDFYNRPLDSTIGTFHFAPSVAIGGDWRCDKSMYGPVPFAEENVENLIEDLNEKSDLLVYEPFISINGTCHVTYMEATNRSTLANEKLNNSIVPITGRTFQEVLRLIYEWSVLANEPFNATDKCAVIANSFLKQLAFTEEELKVLKNLPQMQIGQFISGSENARQRPSNIPELNNDIENILWRRMASSSLCFIIAHNPTIWEFDEVLQVELEELNKGISRFRSFYGIPEYEPLDESGRAVEFAEIVTPKHNGYVQTQLQGFKNKQTVINKAITDKAHNAL